MISLTLKTGTEKDIRSGQQTFWAELRSADGKLQYGGYGNLALARAISGAEQYAAHYNFEIASELVKQPA